MFVSPLHNGVHETFNGTFTVHDPDNMNNMHDNDNDDTVNNTDICNDGNIHGCKSCFHRRQRTPAISRPGCA